MDEYYGFALEPDPTEVGEANSCIQIRATMGIRVRTRQSSSRLVMLMSSDNATLENRLRERGYDEPTSRDRVRHGAEEMAQAPLCDLVVPDADILSEVDALRILQDYLSSR